MTTPAATTGTTVAEILAGVLDEPAAALREQPILAAHDWDSLTSLEALAQLEARFHVSLDLTAFNAARTVDDMTALVTAATPA
ncbi:hypothetical protein GCM10010435_36010 [Winogradskya consettensis]|uniref:Carrier domain-containing protein n=1 Tax=Winogradskya consettensis TaxID=113560 RepID=A0A919VJJ7_9ACTN|nr:acyl carrier protein [Actinoplanes consettensis]GIM68396.1 hypothetical protein Aco04nite_10520 [Actinoplanes consettensis]